MSILVVTSFNHIGEAQQVFDAMVELKHTSESSLDALMITKTAEGNVFGAQLGGGKANLPVIHANDAAAGIEEPNRVLLGSVLGAMAPDTASLFVTVADTESSVVILTLLLLFLPSQRIADSTSTIRNAQHEDSLNRILQSYQKSVLNLDHLDHRASETEVNIAYSAVDSAYAALMSSFREVANATDRKP